MAGSVNKVIIIGNLGDDPDIRSMQSGDRVANLSIATSESWKDKQTGERKENTQWHRCVLFGGVVDVAEKYLKKGSKVYIEGQLETRSWEQNGEKKYTTEIVLRPYKGELTMLDSRSGDAPSGDTVLDGEASASPSSGGLDELEDEIPF